MQTEDTSTVLTISCGAFVCTVEGFDRPFNTLRTISDHLEGLPDVDHRPDGIAAGCDAERLRCQLERDTGHPVIARLDATGLHLIRRQDATRCDDDASTTSAIGARSAADAGAEPLLLTDPVARGIAREGTSAIVAERQSAGDERSGDIVTLIRRRLGETGLSEDEKDRLVSALAAIECDDACRSDGGEPMRDVGDEAVDRLLDTADAHLLDASGRRRRATAAHLKAAAAATRDTGASAPEDRDDAEARYRGDLDRVTGAPQHCATAARYRTGKRLPTLLLIPAFRIDRPDRDARSRGGRSDTDALDAATFAEFAARHGADDLGEIILAAADYATMKEDRDGVSRARLLRLAQWVTEDFGHEEGLRCLGRLLRAGRLQKVGEDRFAPISPDPSLAGDQVSRSSGSA